MRILADGNNLLYALWDEGEEGGRERLCKLLGELSERTRLELAVVFDGHAPQGGLAKQIADSRIGVYYSESRTADEVLEELIAAHSAPRRLTVVSSDHEIIRMARRRECHVVRSQEFARQLLAPPPPKHEAAEPPGKRAGLHDDVEIDEWLMELGLTDQPDRQQEEKR